jgi:hypothetical protein
MRWQKTEMMSEEAGQIIHILESLARAGKARGKAGRESMKSREKTSSESNEKIGIWGPLLEVS